MPNTFAYLVLFSWPLVVLILFRKLPPTNALIWSIVAGYLFLPERVGIDFPLIPALDKTLIPAAAAGIMCLLAARQSQKLPTKLKPIGTGIFTVIRGRSIFWGLLALLFLTPIITTIQNKEPLIYGSRYIAGLKTYDIASMNLRLGVVILPYLLARRYLASDQSHRLLLQVLVIAGLGYGFLALYEVRMSPQLNRMVYGFFPHSFSQHIRGSGFRPLVFLNHGLLLAIFFAMTILASFTLWRASTPDRAPLKWLRAGLWLMLVLFLSRSLGAFVIVLLLVPPLIFFNERSHILLAMIIAGGVLLYPMLRGAGYVPVNSAYILSQSIDEERAESLKFRFDNEDTLLLKVNEKPWAGWGGWGRSRIYDNAGKDISVTDALWIITIGTYGWLGYIAQFGLLCLPTFMLGWHRNRLNISRATAGLALVLGATLLDLLINASLTPVTWLIAGALMGQYQTVGKVSEDVRNPNTPRIGKEAVLMAAETIRDPLRPKHKRQSRNPKKGLVDKDKT